MWGEKAEKLFIAVHGNMSCKDDTVIALLAEEAAAKGYQVLSFDLPEHGDRKNLPEQCRVQNCVRDLGFIMAYARTLSADISLFGCSMGAYFSLVAYRAVALRQCLFLSPVVSMERVIENMMKWFNVTPQRLEAEGAVSTPVGHTLYWDYYCYVKAHPMDKWNTPTAILYGTADNIVELDVVSAFAKRFDCKLQVLENGEHYFHSEEQLVFYRRWLKENIA